MELYAVSFYNDPETSWRDINKPFPRDPTSSQTKLPIWLSWEIYESFASLASATHHIQLQILESMSSARSSIHLFSAHLLGYCHSRAAMLCPRWLLESTIAAKVTLLRQESPLTRLSSHHMKGIPATFVVWNISLTCLSIISGTTQTELLAPGTIPILSQLSSEAYWNPLSDAVLLSVWVLITVPTIYLHYNS